jgi:4-carboxymuconolactone decarboxylase
MARVSLLREEDHPELAPLIGRIKGRRRGLLLNLYRMLLHSPSVAEKWFEQNNAIRWETQLDGKIREIAIIRVGAINRAAYVLKAHVPKMALDEGVTLAQCDALVADWRGSTLFDAREQAVLAYAEAVTKDIRAPDAVFEPLRRHFSERQIVELTVLIATYNMHSRVLEALQIERDEAM